MGRKKLQILKQDSSSHWNARSLLSQTVMVSIVLFLADDSSPCDFGGESFGMAFDRAGDKHKFPRSERFVTVVDARRREEMFLQQFDVT